MAKRGSLQAGGFTFFVPPTVVIESADKEQGND